MGEFWRTAFSLLIPGKVGGPRFHFGREGVAIAFKAQFWSALHKSGSSNRYVVVAQFGL